MINRNESRLIAQERRNQTAERKRSKSHRDRNRSGTRNRRVKSNAA